MNGTIRWICSSRFHLQCSEYSKRLEGNEEVPLTRVFPPRAKQPPFVPKNMLRPHPWHKCSSLAVGFFGGGGVEVMEFSHR